MRLFHKEMHKEECLGSFYMLSSFNYNYSSQEVDGSLKLNRVMEFSSVGFAKQIH